VEVGITELVLTECLIQITVELPVSAERGPFALEVRVELVLELRQLADDALGDLNIVLA